MDERQVLNGPWTSNPEGSSNRSTKSGQYSALEAEVMELRRKVAPPSQEDILTELGRCLRLTAPVGMTNEDRREWLLVAIPEVAGIPSCEFFDACAEARKKADHPAKIIPAIRSYKAPSYANAAEFKIRLRNAEARWSNRDAGRLESKPVWDDADERRKVAAGMAELMEELRARDFNDRGSPGHPVAKG